MSVRAELFETKEIEVGRRDRLIRMVLVLSCVSANHFAAAGEAEPLALASPESGETGKEQSP